MSADAYVSTGQGVTGFNMFAYCLNNPVNMSDSAGNWPDWISSIITAVSAVVATIVTVVATVAAVATAAAPVVAGVNHVINYANAKRINIEIEGSYTREKAEQDINAVLRDYGSKGIKIESNNFMIYDSYLVMSRYDRQKISTILSRIVDSEGEHLTSRSAGNLSAEWWAHNVAVDILHNESYVTRAKDANLDFDFRESKAWKIQLIADCLEIMGGY